MEYIKTTLGEISIGKGQYGIGASAVEYSPDLYTYLRITDINDDGTLNIIDLKSVDDPKAREYLLSPNDIVFARTGNSTGRNYFYDGSDGEFVYAGFLIKFSIDPSKVNPRYIKYYCLSDEYKGWVQGHSTGSTRGNINAKTYAGMEISLPPREQQDNLVKILDDLEAKRKTNSAINRNLEEQARVVFNSWFVKFEPFNEPMKESPIGYEVPESLELVQISSLEHILETGRRPKGGAVTEGIPSVGAESIKGIGNFGTGNIKFIPEDFAAKLKTGAVKGYELMIYKDGGKPGEFHPHFSMFGEGYPFEKFFINEHVFKLDFGNRGYNEFAYFYFQTDYVLNWLENNGGKAAIPGINQNVVKSIWIFKPSHPKVKEYCEWVQPLFTQILKNCYANMQLSSLRDTLLPKLMSGELDVSELDI